MYVTFHYRFPTRPAHQTSKLLRVRVYKEDPLTHEPTNRTIDDIKACLDKCSRIENYAIADVEEGLFGNEDEETYACMVGRKPKGITEEELPISFCDCPPFFEVRIVIKEKSKTPTASFMARLLRVHVREIVMCNRDNIRGIPFSEIAQAWIDDYDKDCEENVEFKMDPDTYRAFYEALECADTAVSNVDTLERAKTIATTAPYSATWPVEDATLKLTLGDITTTGDEMAPLISHSPYDYPMQCLATLSDMQLDEAGMPTVNRLDFYTFLDRTSVDHEEETIASNLMEDTQTQMAGLIKTSFNHPTVYRYDTLGRGLAYERIGAYARLVKLDGPQDPMPNLLELSPASKFIFNHAKGHEGRLTLPWHVFVAAFLWGFWDADPALHMRLSDFPSFTPDASNFCNPYEQAGVYALKWIDAHMRILNIETIDEYFDEMFTEDVELSASVMPEPKWMNERWRGSMEDLNESFAEACVCAGNYDFYKGKYQEELTMWDVEAPLVAQGICETVGSFMRDCEENGPAFVRACLAGEEPDF